MRGDQLSGAARALYDDFRRVGLTEAQAVAAATDDRVQLELQDFDLGVTFRRHCAPDGGPLAAGEIERRRRSIGEAAASRAGVLASTGHPANAAQLAVAQLDLTMSAAFGRSPSEQSRRIVEATASAGRRPLRESAGTLTAARLREAAAATTAAGRLRVRLIAPGRGASGVYSAEVLKRDGPKVFVAGTQSFLDHPTASESYDRPERSVRDLAGRLATTAVWQDQGPLGAGLYADLEVFPHAAPLLASIGPHVGISIRAEGEADAAGNITALTAAHSVDVVTRAGAGGAVVS